jgi:hypothetical protein
MLFIEQHALFFQLIITTILVIVTLVYAISSWFTVKEMKKQNKSSFMPIIYPYDYHEEWIEFENVGPGTAFHIKIIGYTNSGEEIDTEDVYEALPPIKENDEIGHRFKPADDIVRIKVTYQDIFENKYNTIFSLKEKKVKEVDYKSLRFNK